MTVRRHKFLIWALGILLLVNLGYYAYIGYVKYQANKVYKTRQPGVVNIYINAIPKSASDHVAEMMISIAKYRRENLTRGHFPDEYFYSVILNNTEPDDRWLFKQHLSPTVANLDTYKRITNKLVLHLRDPREVILSWVHHLDADYKPDRKLVDGYYSKSFEEKLDWNIENTLPKIIAWIQGWLEIKEQEDNKPNGLKIMITTYDEMLKDELALFKKIIKFYDLSTYALNNYQPIPKTQARHFRRGDRNEWRTVFSTEQKQKMAAIIPADLLKRFKWDTSYD